MCGKSRKLDLLLSVGPQFNLQSTVHKMLLVELQEKIKHTLGTAGFHKIC